MISAKSLLLLSVLSASPTVELWEFTAPWCGSCRQMSPVVQQLKSAGVAVKQIQFDQNKQLAAQAQVRSLPCFLVVSQGRILRRHEGTASFDQLVGLLNQGTENWSSLAAGQPTNDIAAVVRGQTAPVDRNMLGRAVSVISDRIGQHRCQQCGTMGNCQCVLAPGGDQPLPAANLLAQAPYEYPTGPGEYPTESTVYPGAKPAGYAAPAATIARAEPASVQRRTATTTSGALDERAIQLAMSATVRLKIKDQQGVSLGTGTVIDVHDNEALVLTCGHIFRDSEGKGEITCDFFGSSAARNIPGKLISYDMRRDVGLVSFRPGVHVTPIPIGGTGCSPKQDDAVFSIGCNHGKDPTTNRNRILAVNRYHGPANLVVGGRPVDGRSGGGLFDDKGRLIGVCNAADQEEDEGLYAALGPIHAELDSSGLSFIYRPRQHSVAAALDNNPPTSDSRQSEYLAPRETGNASQGKSESRDHSGIATEQTLRAETNPADETEIICIMRSNNPQHQQGTAFVLEHPSRELIDKLSQEMAKRGPHAPTQHHRQIQNEPLRQTLANDWEKAAHLR